MNKIKLIGSFFIVVFIVVMFFIVGNSKKSDQENLKPVMSSLFEVDTIRLPGGDWGYPSPFAHYPRGPGGFKMCLIFDSLLERDEKGLIPWLAVNYEILNNGKKCNFSISMGEELC